MNSGMNKLLFFNSNNYLSLLLLSIGIKIHYIPIYTKFLKSLACTAQLRSGNDFYINIISSFKHYWCMF